MLTPLPRVRQWGVQPGRLNSDRSISDRLISYGMFDAGDRRIDE